MFKKNEMLKTAIITGLVLFATISLLTIVVLPGVTSPAHAFMRTMPRGGGLYAPGDGLSTGQACACDAYY
ncbi:MAG TPA: hypothetical protein VIR31_06430 [Nitrososphaeraceae archaeon]